MKLCMVFCTLALLSDSAQATRRNRGADMPDPETVEIDFEPMGPDDGPELLMGPDGDAEMLMQELPSSKSSPKARPSKPESGLSEKELDDVLSDMLGSPSRVEKEGPPNLPPGIPADIADAIPPGAEVIMGNAPDGSEIVEIDAPEGPPPQIMMNGPPGGIPDDMRSSIPMSALKSLFPPGQMIIEEDDGAPPDAVMEDLMREMSDQFQQQLLPIAQQAAAEDNLPNSCSGELKAFCKGAPSRLHCLGKHSNDISDTCRADVGKSVPFLCSGPIDAFCDVLMGGILSCLANHLKDLDGPCKDSVQATKHIINKVNTQKASVTDPKTGQKKSVTPKSKTSLSQREANLDAKLIGLSHDASTAKKQEASEHAPVNMPARVLGHHADTSPLHHGASKHTSQGSPPFLAVFVPFSLLTAGAALLLHFRPVIAAKLMQMGDAKPLTTGTELISPSAHSIPMKYPGRLP
jgi:hypothetical protein